MPPIKITLNRLIELFGRSVNSDLPEPVRALAARLMTLTAHVIRIEQAVATNVKNIGTLTEQLSTLTEVVQTIATDKSTSEAPSAGAPPEVTAAPMQSAPANDQQQEEENEDPFVAAARAEAEAEVAAINASQPEVSPVVVLPRSKKVGGVK